MSVSLSPKAPKYQLPQCIALQRPFGDFSHTVSEALNRQRLAWQQPPAATHVGGRPAAERSRRTDTAPAMSRRNLIKLFTNSKVHQGRAISPWVKTVTLHTEFQCSLIKQVWNIHGHTKGFQVGQEEFLYKSSVNSACPLPIYARKWHAVFNRRC